MTRRVGSARRAALRRTAGAAALVAALAGCGASAQPGAAAVVGDERISVAELQRTTEAVARSGAGQGADPGELQRAVLRELVLAEVVQSLGGAQGVQVTPAQVDAVLGAEPGLQQLPRDFRETIARSTALASRVATRLVPGEGRPAADPELQARRQQAFSEAIVAEARRLGVLLNPRYGRWDPRSVAIEELPSGGLARPADAGEPAQP